MGRHIWEARYFVLYADRLLYFRRYDDSFDLTKYAGCIRLVDIDSVIAKTSSSSSTRYRFNIQLAHSDKIFQLMSDGEEVDKGKKWNTLLLEMLPERGSAQKSEGKFWKGGMDAPPQTDITRRRASSIRRQNVYAGRGSFSGLEEKRDPMTAEDRDLVLLVISDTRVALKHLDVTTKEKLMYFMTKKQFKMGQVCMRVNEPNSLFFVVKSGSFNATKPNKKVTYAAGTSFGEEDLLSEQNSKWTITAAEDSVCWCLERHVYKEIITQSNLGKAAQYLAILSTNRYLSALSEHDLRQLAGALEEAEYGPGEDIVTQGDPGESFYIVKSGECEVIRDNLKVAQYFEGDSFGERALLHGAPRAATVVAVTEVVVLVLDRTTFTNLLGPLDSIKTKHAKEEKPPDLAAYNVGDRLEVQTPKGPQRGTVKYIGYPHFTKRGRLGMELDLANGKHDGHSKGQRYFKCAGKHGIFVAADEVLAVLSKAKPATKTVASPKSPKVSQPVAKVPAPKPAPPPLMDLFELLSAPVPAPAPASVPPPNQNLASLFLSQPDGPRLVSPQPAPAVPRPVNPSSADPFAAIAQKSAPSYQFPPTQPATHAPAPAPTQASNDPFAALAAGSARPQPQQPPPNKSAILDDIFNSQATQLPAGPDLSQMTGPMKWTPPAVAAPQSTNNQGFTPSNFANNFLASLPDDLEDRELHPSSKRPVAKPSNGNVSDSDGEDESSRAKGPAPAKTFDDLFGQFALSPAAKTASPAAPPASMPTKPPPAPASAVAAAPPAAMPSKPPPAPVAAQTPLMAALGVVPRASEVKDPFGQLDTELGNDPFKIRQTRFSTDEEPAQRPARPAEPQTVAVSIVPHPPRDHKPCKVDQFVDIGELGKGTFGTVRLVQDPATQFTFALKTIDKQYLIQHNQVDFIRNERLCLSMMDHSFLVKMYSAAMDERNIYFILEPVMGGELFSLLNDKDKFDQNQARFYAASVVLAFEYMHSVGIVYRDLKPENILLDDVGHVKLTDFGFSKQLGNSKTHTFCGTPDYLSPEIVNNEGHGFGTDWWCLGILIYEMLTGSTPFFHEGGPLLMYEKIVGATVSYPDYISEEAKDLIGGLLAKKEAKRLGVMNGGADLIKQHPFFDGFDWNALASRTLPAPYPMPLKDKFDLSHFADRSNGFDGFE